MAIPALDPQCACDALPQSAFGPVEDDEVLIRVLTNNHYRGAKVLPSAFRLADIIADGVSLVRRGMVDVIEFQAVAEEIRIAANADAVQGALMLRAELIRGLRWPNGDRKLCLFDDPVIGEPAMRDNPAHCMAVSPIELDRVDAQEIRDNLLTIFAVAHYLNDLFEAAA